MDQQRASVAAATERRLYEQIFEIQPLLPEERREIMEKQGKCDRNRALPADYDLGRRAGAEQGGMKARFGHHA